MKKTASKKIDGVAFYLDAPRELRSLTGEQYIWSGVDGRDDHLTQDEAARYGVTAYRGALSHPVRRAPA